MKVLYGRQTRGATRLRTLREAVLATGLYGSVDDSVGALLVDLFEHFQDAPRARTRRVLPRGTRWHALAFLQPRRCAAP